MPTKNLPNELPRGIVLEAIELYNGGIEHSFHPSTDYDLVVEGQHYPPKAIVGLAAMLITGNEWVPADFSGGKSSKCFRLLTEAGFEVERKDPIDHFESKFGLPADVQVGDEFPDRKSLREAGIHAPLQAGIAGSASNGGATSIVLSGGYEDDQDLGDIIIYTGQGGQENGQQVADQELTRGNAALVVNVETGRPVRVSRGANHKSELSPRTGYRFAGLYRVVDYWQEPGLAGFRMFRYRLERILDDAPRPKVNAPAPVGSTETARRESRIVRVVRDTKVSNWVKELYDYRCQVCGEAVPVATGLYAEGAHIRPLGAPHDGPDTPENILCLCPNHHVMFDRGTLAIADDLTLMGMPGSLAVLDKHSIDLGHLAFHRKIHGFVDVVAGVLIRGTEVLVARRAPSKSAAGKWEFPGGKIDQGETPKAALAREWNEEFGLKDVTVGPLLADEFHRSPTTTVRLRAFKVESVTVPQVSTDHDEIKLVSLDDLSGYELSATDTKSLNSIKNAVL